MMHARPLDDQRSVFRQFLDNFYADRRSSRGGRRDVWRPPTDVYETDSDIVIKVSLAGVRPEQIGIECNGEVVTIHGVRESADQGTVRAYHQMEIRNGYFERRIAIHRPFDPRQARAQYEDGFLRVFIPKAPRPVRRIVSIRLNL